MGSEMCIRDRSYIAKSTGNISSLVHFARMCSALEIVRSVLPFLKTMEELMVAKFLRTSSVVLDNVTVICHNQRKKR